MLFSRVFPQQVRSCRAVFGRQRSRHFIDLGEAVGIREIDPRVLSDRPALHDIFFFRVIRDKIVDLFAVEQEECTPTGWNSTR